jgi:NAD(P) transhydrogenase
MSVPHFDLVVIGSGPAGHKGAIAAAKLGKQVAIVDKLPMIGGVCLHTGTIPSKTLREAVLYLSGFRQRAFYGRDYTLRDSIASKDLSFRVLEVVNRELQVLRDQLKRNGVRILSGHARFLEPHRLRVESAESAEEVSTDHVLISCGTRPAHDPRIPIDGRRVFDSDRFLIEEHHQIPRTATIVGGGVIGIEYASMLSALGVETTVVEARPALLEFVDREVVEALQYHMRHNNTVFRLNERVESVNIDERDRVVAVLESGKRLTSDILLYAVGRQANTDSLDLEAAGLQSGKRGLLQVNEYFQTAVPHIYAAGDVIGFPSLASTAMEEGRLASYHMFGSAQPRPDASRLPYGIYTIPEISMVGQTEEQLTQAKVPYEVGIARFEELAKGAMIGDSTGFLKLLFHIDTHEILGVHVIGESAAELVHIGLVALGFKGKLEFLRDTVFNYPTLAEAYKVAAFDGLNKL